MGLDVAGNAMTLGGHLPPSDHVARHLKNTWIDNDPDTGLVFVDPDAFKPRVFKDGTIEEDISVNHIEFFGRADIIASVIGLEQHLRGIGRNVKKNGGFAVCRVQDVIEAGVTAGARLEVREQQVSNDPSRSVIRGIELDADLVHAAVALTAEVFRRRSKFAWPTVLSAVRTPERSSNHTGRIGRQGC